VKKCDNFAAFFVLARNSTCPKIVPRLTVSDSYFQLLFVKGKKVVSHATINRDIVSYFGLDSCNIYNANQKFHIKMKLYLDEHRIVHQK